MQQEWWTESSGRIELQIALNDAESASHPGQCDDDVAALRKKPYIQEQLDRLAPSVVAACLREYGAWDDGELSDHEANLDRLIWIACNDVSEEVFMRNIDIGIDYAHPGTDRSVKTPGF